MEERARNAKLLNSHFSKHSVDVAFTEKPATQEDQPRRRSITKSPKSTPLAKSNTKNHIEPANHVTSLLLNEIMRYPHGGESSVEPFLSTVDYLDTISDLVLAIPAIGAAIHRYKPTKEFQNAISGCPDPPQTAVSYILHTLLPQPRLNFDSRPMSDTVKALRLQAYRKTKISQAGARLIVCLVARSGELRRYVVEQIVFALSCGQLPYETEPTVVAPTNLLPKDDQEVEMWAISSWGDLVAGLSSPRSSIGSLATNQDSTNSTLSFPVIKLMLEHKVAHALMLAIGRIALHHPMASSSASSIIRPLEIYTRGGVFTTVNEMQMREKAKSVKASKDSRRATIGTIHRSESDLDDVAIEDEFHNNPARRLDGGGSFDESVEHSSAEDDNESIDEDSDESSEIEVRLGNVDDSSSEGEDEFSDESEEEEDDDESDGDDMDEDADSEPHYSDESEDEEEELDEMEEVEDDNFLFDANAEDEVNNGLEQGAAGGNEGLDESMMEGWTRVETGGRAGLGRMLLEMVQPHGRQHHLANGGFLMDAAETMLGNILRGDIGLEGISAEIEDSLGIRVMRRDRGDGRAAALGLSAGLTNRPNPNGSAGTTIGGVGRPAVHQNGIVSSNSVFGNVFETSATLCVANEDDHDRRSEIPSSYDTNLFPEGVAAVASSFQSTMLRGGGCPLVHPLIQSLTLPPATSINSVAAPLSSQREGHNSTLQRNIGMATGSYIAGANGSIIQVNDRLQTIHGADQVTRRTNPSTFSIWADDGTLLDDFSATFGQALDSFLQDASVQEGEASSSDPPRSQQDTSSQNCEAPPAPAAQESQSETAEVSSAMAAGLTISQQASDHPPNPSISNDQTGNQEDDSEAADDAMAEDRSTGEADDEAAVEDEVIPDAGSQLILGVVAEPLESNQYEEALDQEVDGASVENVSHNDEGVLVCPPAIDPEVFNSLPPELQQELVLQHQVDTQISESGLDGLDPDVLAALPEEMRREVIEQEQQQQRLRELQASQAADPANAEEYLETNASFLASLSPDLREESECPPFLSPRCFFSVLCCVLPLTRCPLSVLLTADDAFISSLPSTLIAEANVLRERVASQHRQRAEDANAANALGAAGVRPGGAARQAQQPSGASRERRQRNGKLRIEKDIVWMENSAPLLTTHSTAAFLSLLYLLIPVQPQRLMHKLMLNLCLCEQSRSLLLNVLISLLNSDKKSVLALLENLDDGSVLVDFPPSGLIGSTSDLVEDRSSRHIAGSLRKRQVGNSAMTVAASLPASACGSLHSNDSIPPVVARRIISCFTSMCKSSPRVAFSMLLNAEDGVDDNRSTDASCLDKLLDLLELNQYSQSASNLEQLFGLLEIVVAPMSLLPKDDQEVDLASAERSSPGREWVKVPRVVVSKKRLHLLINILYLESCKDSSGSFLKISALLRR